jgi:hypothetical protein
MNSNRWSLLPWLAGALVSAALPARAQEDPQQATQRKPPGHLRVFRLENVTPQEVMQVLLPLIDQRMQIAPDPRLNQLLVQSDPETLDTVASLVEMLDVPAAGAEQKSQATRTVIQLRNRSVEDLGSIVSLHLSPQGRYELDLPTNSLIVSDVPAVGDSLRELLVRLDAHPSSLDVEFFVVGSGGTEMLPEELSGVSAELGRMGLRQMGLLTRARVRTAEGASFEASGSFGSAGNLEIKGSARAREQGGERLAEIHLTAEINVRVRLPDGDGVQNQSAELQSTLTIPMGHWMVVGMAPCGGDPSEPLVLVVRCSQR